jgi:hypothetical protein
MPRFIQPVLASSSPTCHFFDRVQRATLLVARLRSWIVSEWEYKKIALSELPRRRNDLDLLNAAGDEGWELVAILANNMAYLKRQIGDPFSERPGSSGGYVAPAEDATSNGTGAIATVGKTSEVKAKYRDPKTKETWSGRGRMASWLKSKQDAGEAIEKYLI